MGFDPGILKHLREIEEPNLVFLLKKIWYNFLIILRVFHARTIWPEARDKEKYRQTY